MRGLRRVVLGLGLLVGLVGLTLAAPLVVAAAVAGQATLPTEFASNYLLASGLVAVLLPGILAVVIQRDWSSEVKGIVAALSCVPAALLLGYTQGVVDRADILRSALIILTISQLLYATTWKPSNLAPRIEERTSPP